MKNFLNQFVGLTPMQRIYFERFIFERADDMLPGYRNAGGNWQSKKVGKVWTLVLPTKDKTVTLTTPFTEGTMNAASASIAFSFLVLSWFWETYYDKMSDASQESFDAIKGDMRDEMYSDANGFDRDALWSLTD